MTGHINVTHLGMKFSISSRAWLLILSHVLTSVFFSLVCSTNFVRLSYAVLNYT